jgi:hypothetical protein
MFCFSSAFLPTRKQESSHAVEDGARREQELISSLNVRRKMSDQGEKALDNEARGD